MSESFGEIIRKQSYYSDISSSLSDQGGAICGDSTFLINKRESLFKKINKEIRSFTPYERFLYFDGQNESTASAPSVGKNYANDFPVHTGTQLADLMLEHNVGVKDEKVLRLKRIDEDYFSE